MNKLIAVLIFCFTLNIIHSVENEWDFIYNQISDIQNPTSSDFAIIQKYLLKGKREYLKWLYYDWYAPLKADGLRYDLKARNLNLGPWKPKGFKLNKRVFNTNSEDKDVCVVSYASYNASYEDKLARIATHLKKSNFTGHFLYRIGGWPDIKGGSLKFIHVPYSFKLCMIREAIHLGYKKIVWVDAAVIPLNKFNYIFDYLEKDGYFLIDHLNKINLHETQKVISAFNLTKEERNSIPEIQASLMGFNVEYKQVQDFLNECFLEMQKLDGFLSPRPEQVAMGVIAHRMELFPQLPYSEVFCDNGTVSYENSENSKYFYLLNR